MTAVRTPLRPSRRSLLLSGALLGLSGCDGASWPWSQSPPPRATVTLAPLTTASELVPAEPVIRDDWAVSPTEDRATALLVHREASMTADLRAATVDTPEGIEVPVPAEATSLRVDGHGARVRVYSTTVVDDRRHVTMQLSADLQEWTSVDLGTDMVHGISAVGGGLVASEAADGRIDFRSVAEDGTVSALSPLTAPDGENWSVTALARHEQRILAVISRRSPTEESRPEVVTSEDDGATWSDPLPLATDGENRSVRDVLVQGGTFVLMGEHDAPVGWDEEVRFRRPIAWSLAEGGELATEEIPLPRWGLENYVDDGGRGDLAPETPMDFLDLSLGLPVLVESEGAITAPVYFADDCRRLVRSQDGTWTAGDGGDYARTALRAVVMDGTGKVYRGHDRALALADGRSVPVEGFGFAQPRDLAVSHGAASDGFTAAFSWRVGHYSRSAQGIRWGSDGERFLLGVDGDRIVRRFPPRFRDEQPVDVGLRHLDGGIALYCGELPEEERVEHPGLFVEVSTDGQTWQDTSGIEPTVNSVSVGTATTVHGIHHLPVGEWVAPEGGGDSLFTPTLYTSGDGITWEKAPSPDIASIEDERAARGGWIHRVAAVGDTVVGIGTVVDAAEEWTPATFVQDGEGWSPRLMDPEFAGADFDEVSQVGSEVLIAGTHGARAVQWTLAADGTPTETYRSDDHSSRGRTLDLGGGALLAGGWIDRPETGIGACLWASLDSGATWQATMLPGQDGRFPAVRLVPDGEAVVVLLDDPDMPHGYRIVDARADVLGSE